jgi:hypothetical protein
MTGIRPHLPFWNKTLPPPPTHTHSAVQYCTVQLHGLIPHALPCLCDGTWTEHMRTAHIQLLKLHSRVMNILHRSVTFSWFLIRMVCRIQICTRYFWSSSNPNHFTLVWSFYIKSSSSLAGSHISTFLGWTVWCKKTAILLKRCKICIKLSGSASHWCESHWCGCGSDFLLWCGCGLRILFLVKMMQICDHWSTLYRPSTAPFWSSTPPLWA